MNLSFNEAVYGCKKDITVDVVEDCSECHGHGGFDKEEWLKVVEETVPPKTIEINKKAFNIRYAANRIGPDLYLLIAVPPIFLLLVSHEFVICHCSTQNIHLPFHL